MNNLDVNADGSVSPIDVLIVVNDINFNGSRTLPVGLIVPPYLDVDGDGSVGPLDVLALVNYINTKGGAGAGEGEGSMAMLGYSQIPILMLPGTEVIRTDSVVRTQLAKDVDVAVGSVGKMQADAERSLVHHPALQPVFSIALLVIGIGVGHRARLGFRVRADDDHARSPRLAILVAERAGGKHDAAFLDVVLMREMFVMNFLTLFGRPVGRGLRKNNVKHLAQMLTRFALGHVRLTRPCGAR